MFDAFAAAVGDSLGRLEDKRLITSGTLRDIGDTYKIFRQTFVNAGVTYAISKNEISSKLLASYIYEPDVAILSEEIIAYAHEDHEYDMKEFLIVGDNPLINMPYEKAFFDLKRQCNVVLIGIVKVENGKRKMYKNPEGSILIEHGNYLLMLMDRKGQDRLKRVFHIEEGV